LSKDSSRFSQLWREVIERVDRFLIPISFGLLTMLVLVQMLTNLPSIRSKVDQMEGRFASVPAEVIPSSVAQDQAIITLFLSPDQTNSAIGVFKNGDLIGNFSSSQLRVTVHEGDRLSIQSSRPATVSVVVDHNDPNLLLPAPGQTVALTPGQAQAYLPSVQFTH